MLSTKTVVETDGQNPQHNGVINVWGGAILRGEPLAADGREGIRGLMLSNAMHLSAFPDRAVELTVEDLCFEALKQRMVRSHFRENDSAPGIAADLSRHVCRNPRKNARKCGRFSGSNQDDNRPGLNFHLSIFLQQYFLPGCIGDTLIRISHRVPAQSRRDNGQFVGMRLPV